MLPAPGALVGGKYRIVRLIGEGGMGSVFEAKHEHLGSSVALKFLHPELAQKPALVARFLQEARVSAAIKSTHVTQVVDVDQTPEGDAYLVMELLEGESLDRRLERSRLVPEAEAVDIGLQILAALEAAHGKNIVHRDLKPDNVWLVPAASGTHVKLLDFGIAKLKTADEFRQITTRPGAMMGTPAYMAPEQAISADQVDARADLYSFGVILYEMLSGTRPIEADDPSEILGRLARGDVEPLGRRMPSLPPGLTRLVDQLVAADPDHRPASAALARAELALYARGASMRPGGTAALVAVPERPSIPATVPPDDGAAPPYAARSVSTAPPSRTGTDSMAEVARTAPQAQAGAHGPSAALPHAPTAIPSRRDGAAPAKKGGGVWLIVVVTGLLVGALGFGIWALMNPFWIDDGPLPPMPTSVPPPPSSVASPVPREPRDREPRTPPPRRVGPEPSPRAAVPAPRGAAPTPTSSPGTSPAPTGVTLPVFPIPSSFPPLQIPSGFFPVPSGFPQIPGITAPTTQAPSSPAPAAAGGAAAVAPLPTIVPPSVGPSPSALSE